MTSDTHAEVAPTRLAEPVRHFVMRFSSSPRGARLARRLAEQWLHDEGLPYGTEAHDALTLIVAELSTNAVRHGHVAGRDFRLRVLADTRTVRVEVTDTRGERLPAPQSPGVFRTRRRGIGPRSSPGHRPRRPLELVHPPRPTG